MKVGILTFHRAINHGAVLQGFALNKKITDMGHESYLVDYCPIKMLEQYKVKIHSKNSSLKNKISNVVKYIPKKEQEKKFIEFRKKYMNITPSLITEEDILRENDLSLDAYITGSDQVWNPEIFSDTVNSAFFLDFVSSEQSIKISYAASFGSGQIKNKFYPEMKKYLDDIKFLSVRENHGLSIIKEISGHNSKQVVDPVFLLTNNEWESMLSKSPLKEPYILLFLMEDNLEIFKIADVLAKNLNIKVINITTSIKKLYCVDKNIKGAGPLDFVSLIKNASYIITNSFHATAFSMIFKKPFLTVSHSKWNSRMESLLNTFELSKQMVTKLPCDNPVSLEKMFHYDTNKLSLQIENKVKESVEFLEEALK